jgi:hypothetical protein
MVGNSYLIALHQSCPSLENNLGSGQLPGRSITWSEERTSGITISLCIKPTCRDTRRRSAQLHQSPRPRIWWNRSDNTHSEHVRRSRVLYPRGPRSGLGSILPTGRSAFPRSNLTTSSVPVAGTSRFRRLAVYTGCPRCAGAPIESRIIYRIFFRYPASNWTWETLLEYLAMLKP